MATFCRLVSAQNIAICRFGEIDDTDVRSLHHTVVAEYIRNKQYDVFKYYVPL